MYTKKEMLEKSEKMQKRFLSELNKVINNEVVPLKFNLISWREDNEDTVIALNPINGVLNIMNPSLALIFKLCDGKKTLKDIEDYLIESFPDIDKKVIQYDLKNAMVQLFSNAYLKLQKSIISKEEVFITDIYNELAAKMGSANGPTS
ncbi:PqqD family peptide modification chaperone [Candidatus Bathyarchaeota archaeon]|nr:PqqD family peptide modification chaperone [Candidatus Bathyarchaeota archaeon]